MDPSANNRNSDAATTDALSVLWLLFLLTLSGFLFVFRTHLAVLLGGLSMLALLYRFMSPKDPLAGRSDRDPDNESTPSDDLQARC